MAYCTLADIKKAITEAVLIQLTDDDNIGAVITENVNKAIAQADSTIDAYCRNPAPFDPVPDKISELSVDIAVYNLYSRSDLDMPDIRKERKDAAIRFLEKVSEGKISQLGATTPAPSTANDAVTVSSAGRERIFSLDKMKGF
jgi:phage gp36-like protein